MSPSPVKKLNQSRAHFSQIPDFPMENCENNDPNLKSLDRKN